ncbi:hypothetical protein AB205_0102230, partial [Aquarana catesbeiana]
GEKSQRTPLIRGDQRPLTSGRRGNPPKTNRAGGGRVSVTTGSGDRDVVDPDPFTSESAQILIGEIMGCNRDLETIRKTSMMFFKKIRTSLMFWGEFKAPPNPFVFWCATIF